MNRELHHSHTELQKFNVLWASESDKRTAIDTLTFVNRCISASARAIVEKRPNLYVSCRNVLIVLTQIRVLSAIFAIVGGGFFLVLPVAFFNGTVAIIYTPSACYGPYPGCGSVQSRPDVGEMVVFWAVLAILGISLSLPIIKLQPKPGSGVALGLAFSLGSITLLFGVVLLAIPEIFTTSPLSYLVFPLLAIVAMTGSTALFSYGLVYGK